MAMMEIWTYRETDWPTRNLVGFSVEAIDGSIGKVDEASNDVGAAYLVVDTGPWIFGKKVMLPAGLIEHVDANEKTIYVHRTKDEIKNAPEFNESGYREDAHRSQIGGYYGPGGMGYRSNP